MRKILQTILPPLVICFAIAWACAYMGYEYARKEKINVADTTRVEFIDTIPYYKPVPKDSLVTRFEVVKLPVVERVDSGAYIYSVENYAYNPDTTALSDSVSVEIPITQKHYSDSTFDLWVSGFHPSLDSIFVYQKTVIQTIREKPKRWSVGVQGGYGYTPQGFLPYVGVGVSYRIFP